MAELMPCPNPSCTQWNPAGRPKCFRCGAALDRKKVEAEDPGAHGGRRALIIIVATAALIGGGFFGLRWKEVQSDAKPPVVRITEPPTLSTVLKSSKDRAVVRGVVTDDHPKEVAVDGQVVPIVDGEFIVQISVGDQPKDVSLVARDKKGNESTPIAFRVEKDAAPPEFVELFPADGLQVTSPVRVTGEANEDLGSAVVGNTPGSVGGKRFEATVNLVAGANDLAVKITDLAGNEATRQLKITYEARQLPEGVTYQDGEFRASTDDMRLILIPGGEFTMGSNAGDADERPEHVVNVSTFLIDETPVTNAQWAKYVSATGAAMRGEPGADGNAPVVNVSFEEAQAYAKWAGRRLPSEAEWEKAARGTDGRAYPWGNDPPSPQSGTANIDGAGDGFAKTSPVGSFEAGASPFGVLDMAGNVWQWTYDWYDAGYYASLAPGAKDPEGPASGEQIALRGGAFTSKPADVRSTNRYPRAPGDRAHNIGFRCALDLP